MRIQSIFIGSVVVGVLSTSYLSLINLLCCFGVMLGGGVAAWHYISTSNRSIDPVEGASLGAGAGFLGSLLSAAFDWALRPLGLDGESVIQNLMGMDMEQMMQQQDEMVQESMMQEPSVGMILITLIMGAILWAVFGALGGAVGASLFGGNDADPDTPPPPPDAPSQTDTSW
ncbi:MAG: hypothetical protein R6U20_13930 [Longimonas sp.]|uniref:hypothetical protein n=1 Tax=Longimonas sp. TaxID=2039626 RepID=UPI003974A4F4